MANTTFNTRISLKYDTYANWVANNPVLLAGEVAVCVVPASTGAVTTEPTVLFKVGDGTNTFTNLGFTSSLAGDVYSWAKASTKPTYTADEISGLADYISDEIQDTNTQYKIEQDGSDGHTFYLYAKDINGAYAVQDTITIPETVYTLTTGTANGTVSFNGTDVAVKGLGSAAYTASTAYDAAGAADTALASAKTYTDEQISENAYDDSALTSRVSTVETAISVLNGDSATEGSVAAQVADAVAQIVADAPEAYDTLKEISDWISSHADSASSMNSAIAQNASDIAELEALIGALPATASSTTVIAYISEVVAALNIDSKANTADLATVATSGDIADLTQASGYVVLDCGSSTVNI